SAADGRQLKRLISRENTGSEVWAGRHLSAIGPSDDDDAYRSRKNETWLAKRLMVSRIHRRKPAGKPMPRHMAQANAKKSAIRAAVEHVFAHQKTRFGVRQCLSDHWRSIGSLIRTIGLARAEAKLTLADIAYNFDRLIFHERRRTMG
ncbi:MAG: hypothetical protein AAGE90_09650, partial [Pseudomonadota bacterium]